MKIPLPSELALILTYRCPMKCVMCNIHKHPTQPEREITPGELEFLPQLKFVNITGGEPFLRDDLADFIKVLSGKARRIVISTSGWYVEKVIQLAEKYPSIGIRVSLEGLAGVNDKLRGRQGSFDHGLKVLLALRKRKIKDIGFGITISEQNCREMLWLYELARNLKMEFATAAVHNSYYFHKSDNTIRDTAEVCHCLASLIDCLLREPRPKSWFRAYFNYGLMQYVQGRSRLLPCQAGTENFFIDPYGEIYPCNGMEPQCWLESMGNIRAGGNFSELWHSPQAARVRQLVADCLKNCWMIGTAAPVMKKYPLRVLPWVIRHKFSSILGKAFSAGMTAETAQAQPAVSSSQSAAGREPLH